MRKKMFSEEADRLGPAGSGDGDAGHGGMPEDGSARCTNTRDSDVRGRALFSRIS